MNFFPTWRQNRQIKKEGLSRLEYRLLCQLRKRSATMEEIIKFLARQPEINNRLTLNEKEFSVKITEKLLKWDMLLCNNSRISLSPKAVKIVKKIGTPKKNRIAEFLEKSSTCSSATFLILSLLGTTQLLFGIFTGSLALTAVAIFIATDFTAITATWWAVKKGYEKKTALRLLLMFIVASLLLIGLGTKGIMNPLPVSHSYPAMLLSLFSVFVLLILSRYQFKNGKKSTSFSFICLSTDSKQLATAALAAFIAERFSYFGIYLFDGVACLIIGILLALSAIRIFTLLGLAKKESPINAPFLRGFLALFTALTIIVVLLLATQTHLQAQPMHKPNLSIELLSGKNFIQSIGLGTNPGNTHEWNNFLRIALWSIGGIIMLLTIAKLIRGIKMIRSNRPSAHQSLVRWFEYRCRHCRDRFFMTWLLKLLSERTLNKSEIIAHYKKQFIEKEIPFFQGMDINIARDNIFEKMVDSYLGHMLYDKRIAINKRDKFYITQQ